MNTLLLHPTDILFFRDGRPMSGSLSGHGAAWPLPTVINHAFHAALHRAGDIFDDAHAHRRGRSSLRPAEASRDRKFGSLTTAGPFPVSPSGEWFFPRPLDAGVAGSTTVTLQPLKNGFDRGNSSLPVPLQHPSASTKAPSKARLESWLSPDAFQSYLSGEELVAAKGFAYDDAFSDAEYNIGIGIDPDSGTQDGERFYSASYLRLREGWRLGVLAEAADKMDATQEKRDLIRLLFGGTGTEIIAGGQQRTCRATLERDHIPLPRARMISGTRVKWVLLTPAIFPVINDHSGGWLPSWINHLNGQVFLKEGDTSRHESEGREAWRKRVAAMPAMAAKLVAAITGKPLPVTGYALPHPAAERVGGAKSTHLAVPAGAVYYFEAENESSAQSLADALNWHGKPAGTQIENRRSTLMGEKGFGLGVCGTWEFHSGHRPGTD